MYGNTSSDYLWCIDPLDGTTNFAHAYPSFAVSIGVLRNAVPVAACVVEFTGGALQLSLLAGPCDTLWVLRGAA